MKWPIKLDGSNLEALIWIIVMLLWGAAKLLGGIRQRMSRPSPSPGKPAQPARPQVTRHPKPTNKPLPRQPTNPEEEMRRFLEQLSGKRMPSPPPTPAAAARPAPEAPPQRRPRPRQPEPVQQAAYQTVTTLRQTLAESRRGLKRPAAPRTMPTTSPLTMPAANALQTTTTRPSFRPNKLWNNRQTFRQAMLSHLVLEQRRF